MLMGDIDGEGLHLLTVFGDRFSLGFLQDVVIDNVGEFIAKGRNLRPWDCLLPLMTKKALIFYSQFFRGKKFFPVGNEVGRRFFFGQTQGAK